jgi:DNA-binding response OmpR family regulator
MSQILVVNNDGARLTHVLNVLNAAGYRASGASTFEEATRALAARSPDLVIADERLGAYNGLHVILRARADHPDVSAIVTTPVRNRALEADARSLNVQCLIKPQSPGEWLAPIWKILNEDGCDGRSAVQCDGVPSMGRI